jgi:hypothetical protein
VVVALTRDAVLLDASPVDEDELSFLLAGDLVGADEVAGVFAGLADDLVVAAGPGVMDAPLAREGGDVAGELEV